MFIRTFLRMSKELRAQAQTNFKTGQTKFKVGDVWIPEQYRLANLHVVSQVAQLQASKTPSRLSAVVCCGLLWR